MQNVQQLVVHHEIKHKLRHLWVVEHPRKHDDAMVRVVMAKPPPAPRATPTQLRRIWKCEVHIHANAQKRLQETSMIPDRIHVLAPPRPRRLPATRPKFVRIHMQTIRPHLIPVQPPIRKSKQPHQKHPRHPTNRRVGSIAQVVTQTKQDPAITDANRALGRGVGVERNVRVRAQRSATEALVDRLH